ncbi:MAG TPA: choice-of-anchor tandem repeat GloVer-containing protein [Rhizomicrobium sp.]|jgi:uncharacterized repeat protein (TIGR03803 family)
MKSLCIVLLASISGCAFVQSVLAAELPKAKEKVLHSFGIGGDGLSPQTALINVNGMLYGTTLSGGSSGTGTLFELDPKTRMEKVLYSFCTRQSCLDGASPCGSLINLNGILYGTTSAGGESGDGTVYSLDPSTVTEKVLYSFCNQSVGCTDGSFPIASLLDINGTLYGVTTSGGDNDGGVVFAIDLRTGAEKVVYSFCSQQKCADGNEPTGNLINVKGTLYGITDQGGSTNCEYGCGTVFSLNPNTGAEKVLYSFCAQNNCTDGSFPYGALIEKRGTLYGTTAAGGANCVSESGCGTAFALNPGTGVETVLYSFCSQPNCADGWLPDDGLVEAKGNLYGTTHQGGNTGCYNNQGCGVAFSLDPNTHAETVLYTFCSLENCVDGAWPFAGLIDVKHTLYGTTLLGGTDDIGTVFSLTR